MQDERETAVGGRDVEAWVAEGRRLAHQLQEQLGPDVAVSYLDPASGALEPVYSAATRKSVKRAVTVSYFASLAIASLVALPLALLVARVLPRAVVNGDMGGVPAWPLIWGVVWVSCAAATYHLVGRRVRSRLERAAT